MLGHRPQARWAWEGAGSRPGNRVPWFQRVARRLGPCRKELGYQRPGPWPPFPLEARGQGCLPRPSWGVGCGWNWGLHGTPSCSQNPAPRPRHCGHHCRGLTEGQVAAEPPPVEPQTARLGLPSPAAAFSYVAPSSSPTPQTPQPRVVAVSWLTLTPADPLACGICRLSVFISLLAPGQPHWSLG